MGAGRLGQAASDAVIVTVRRPLTRADAVTWPVWPVEHCIRIEGVRGSNPLSSTLRCLETSFTGVSGHSSHPGGLGLVVAGGVEGELAGEFAVVLGDDP
jgi:hypothetical protein